MAKDLSGKLDVVTTVNERVDKVVSNHAKICSDRYRALLNCNARVWTEYVGFN